MRVSDTDQAASDAVVMSGSEAQSYVWTDGAALYRRSGSEEMKVEPWGSNSVRVRVRMTEIDEDEAGGLLAPSIGAAQISVVEGQQGQMSVGRLTVELNHQGNLRFLRSDDGTELTAEEPIHFQWPGPRNFTSEGNGYFRLEQQFRAYTNERFYGLGQHQHGRLDQKGLVVELLQRNAEVSIPFLVSSRGYGLLWNNPAVGRVELGHSATRWVANSARNIDYWFTAGSPREIAGEFAEATGHAPTFPEWAIGFWQSKLRYASQDELMSVAREYKDRGLPLAVIVVDYFHWPHEGDWRFEPDEWPDPDAMVNELKDMGTKLMVSVWPSVSTTSENYREMFGRGLLVATEQGMPFHWEFPDRSSTVATPVSYYDPTNPGAREYVWRKVAENYYEHGIRLFWLDACEPELRPGHPRLLRFAAGPGESVINRYPLDHARTVYDGMRTAGEDEVITLCRSAWVGSQRYGAAVWSGDIPTTFPALRNQIVAGLNIGLSGIPWWTTDIGGFFGGDPEDPQYRELMIRWFQYAAWCPLFRLHGNREPQGPLGANASGGPNEVWSYGEEAYAIFAQLIHLRERNRPYISKQMRVASEQGIPPMRPLWFDYPEDETAWESEDEFLFGPDVIVAPITEFGARSRQVYLPRATRWIQVGTGDILDGGSFHRIAAPLEQMPLFVRHGSSLNAQTLATLHAGTAETSQNGRAVRS